MERIYDTFLSNHFAQYEQILFLAGPRQVGKTTISKNSHALTDRFVYLNWDRLEDRQVILTDRVMEAYSLDQPIFGEQRKPLIIFDELHKYPGWKNFLKGLIDTYKGTIHIVVTGSAKLNVYRRGNDSLMGRYFLCRVHPLSVREIVSTVLPIQEMQAPIKMSDELYERLFAFGGFPEPYLKHQKAFSTNWLRMRHDQFFREDIRDLTNLQELNALEGLAEVLKLHATKQINLTKLGSHLQLAATTVKRWIDVLSDFYYCFTIRPWSKNIVRSLIKEPKVYLWDWSEISDLGMKFENFVAAHLLKAVHLWTDLGFGDYELYYLRDQDKREVDFLITKDDKPWIMIEAKTAEQPLSTALAYFQEKTKAPYAFQITHDMPFIEDDCFKYHQPIRVPAKTLLSQLI